MGARALADVTDVPSLVQRCVEHSDCRSVGLDGGYCQVGALPYIAQRTDRTCLGCWACCLYPDRFQPRDGICPQWCDRIVASLANHLPTCHDPDPVVAMQTLFSARRVAQRGAALAGVSAV
jgi:hypothetical protein